MGFFSEIPDETYKLAGDVIKYASGAIKEEPYTDIPDIAMIVAGAAVAMEKAEVKGPYFSQEVKASDWLKEGSLPWRYLHGAVAQVLDKNYSSQIEGNLDAEKVMRHIVSDTLYRSQVKKMEMERLHPSEDNARESYLEKHFPGDERNRLERYVNDADFREKSRKEEVGSYHAIPQYDQNDLFEKFTTKPLPGNLDFVIESTSSLIADYGNLRYTSSRQFDGALADYKDYDQPLFNKVTPEILEDYKNLTSGKMSPVSEAQAVVVAHAKAFLKEEERPTKNAEILVQSAHLQFLADHYSPTYTKNTGMIEGVGKIENFIATVKKAESDYINMRDNPLSEIENTPVHSQFRPMTPNEQVILYTAIEKENLGAPLKVMGVALDAYELKTGTSLSPEKQNDRNIVFENMSEEMISMAESHQLADLYRKGDKVRLVEGPTGDRYKNEFIDEVMTIEQTVVVGGVESNGMGGSYPVMTPQYKFEGIQGRWPAMAFQHERGDEHAVAVVMEKDDRLWMVPLTAESIKNNEVEVLPAREIQKTDFPPSMEGYGLKEMKSEAATEPMMGEFTFRPLEGYKSNTGPVELSFVPWSSKASSEEVEKASKSIENHMAEEIHLNATKNLYARITAGMDR